MWSKMILNIQLTGNMFIRLKQEVRTNYFAYVNTFNGLKHNLVYICDLWETLRFV